MENTDAVIEEGEAADSVEESDPDVAGPKVPDNVKSKKEEPVIKKKRITVSQEEDESCYILIKNLTRPFTLMQLQTMLKRTGTLEDFWIDRFVIPSLIICSSIYYDFLKNQVNLLCQVLLHR